MNYQQPPQGPYYQQPHVHVIVQQQPQMMFVKAPMNHGLHIVLDVVTCGAWIPIHFICWLCR
jgi:hypothetical protein